MLMKLSSFAALTVVALGIAACSGADPSESSTDSTTEDLTGKSCGGFVAHPKSCPAGYSCIANAHIPDLPGHCVKNGCVQNVICAINAHFDHATCKCEPNQCVQNVICATNQQFDHSTCKCVPHILNGVMVNPNH